MVTVLRPTLWAPLAGVPSLNPQPLFSDHGFHGTVTASPAQIVSQTHAFSTDPPMSPITFTVSDAKDFRITGGSGAEHLSISHLTYSRAFPLCSYGVSIGRYDLHFIAKEKEASEVPVIRPRCSRCGRPKV